MAVRIRPAPRQTSAPVTNWRSVLIAGGAAEGRIDFRDARDSGRWHTGEDLGKVGGGSLGAAIRSPLHGIVKEAGWGVGGGDAFGNAILIQLDDGNYMYLAHLSQIGVRPGQEIKPYQFLGKVGSTGTRSTGPHLHLEIRTKSSRGDFYRDANYLIDPVSYMNKATKGQRYTAPSGNQAAPNGTTTGTTTGNTTTNTIVSGGGGGGMGKVKFTKKDFYAILESKFGDLDTLLDMDAAAVKENGGKSIRWAVDEAVRQKIVDPSLFLTLLNKTAWFQKYGKDTTERLIEERSKPGVFQANVAQVQATIESQAASYGLTLPEGVAAQLARDSYVYLWTPETILNRLQETPGTGVSGGSIGEAYEKLDEYGYLYGVDISEADQWQLRNNILDQGAETGTQAMLDQIQERSAQMYSPFADQIRKGTNLRTLIAPYLGIAQNLLEVSDASLDVDDPLFRNGNGFQMTDQKTGQVVVRPLSDFEKMVKQDPRWLETTNAREEASKKTSGILRLMGLI